MSAIRVVNETTINIGNLGFVVRAWPAQQMLVDFATPSGVYVRATDYEVESRVTNAWYVSGVVVEGGDILNLDPNGSIPSEYNGAVLSSDATVIIPEIFLSDKDQSETGTLPPTPPAPEPPLDQGKVANGANVYLLLHADTDTPWTDSSTNGWPVIPFGSVALDPIRGAFGSSIKLIPTADDTETIDVDESKAGLYVEDVAESEIFSWDDPSFTFEARIRMTDMSIASTQTFFAYGGEHEYMSLRMIVVPDGQSQLDFTWRRPTTEDEDAGLISDGDVPGSMIETILMDIDASKIPSKPDEFQQFVFLYDKIRGQFACFIDGERIGFVNASQFTSPSWGGLSLKPKPETEVFNFSVGLPPVFQSGQQTGETNFVGNLDEVRFTINEALYGTDLEASKVYPWPWPNPIVQEDITEEPDDTNPNP